MTLKLQSLRTQYLDNNGNPLTGGQLFFYEAGTTTKVTTYSDTALSVVNTNPIVLNAGGRPNVEIFLAADNYKVVLAPATDTDPPVAPIWTEDDYEVSAGAAAFSGGINVGGYTEHLVNAQTGTTYTLLTGDLAKLVTHSNPNPIAITLPQGGTTGFDSGWYYHTQNKGAGTATITPVTSTINGLATLELPTNSGCMVVCDGSNYQITGLYKIEAGVNAQTGTTYTMATGDIAKFVSFTNVASIAVTLPEANTTTFKSGWYFDCANLGAGVVTITPTTSTIGGLSSFALAQGETARVISDGTNYQLVNIDSISTNAQTGTSYTVAISDRGRLVTHSNASATAVTLPQASSSDFNQGWYYDTFNKGAGVVTITPTTSTINGAATYVLDQNTGVRIISDGTNYQIHRGGIKDDEVTTAKILDDAVTLAKITTTAATVAAGDSFVLSDADDSDAMKKDTIQGILDLIPSASATVEGIIELSTDAEYITGSLATRAITPANLGSNQSIAQDGYKKFGGGLIIQWGDATASAAGTTVSFNTAFPNTVFTIYVLDNQDSFFTTMIGEKDTLAQFNALAAGAGPFTMNWLAIGN